MILLSGATSLLAADRAVLVELFGGTWCGYCPTAYAALQLLREEYTEDEFIPLYYHVGGADPFRTSETEARASYYGVGGVPHVEFDGVDSAVGVLEDEVATANWYRPKINARLAVPSPVVIRSTGLIDTTGGWVTAVFKAVDTVGFTNLRAQFILYEDGLSYGGKVYDWTVRDMLPTEFVTLSAPGDSVEITRNFTVDPTWDFENMRLVVFLENTSPQEIVQAAYMPPAHDLAFTSDDYADEIDYFGEALYTAYLENTGTRTDTVTVNIMHDELPPGVGSWDWFAMYCDTDGICYFGAQDFVLEPGEIDTFTVHVTDYLGNVQGRAVTSLTAQSHGDPNVSVRETYGTFVDLPSVLLVDDDGGDAHETYLETALADTGYPTMVWDAEERGRPGSTLLQSFWAVCWTTGGGDVTYLTPTDEQRMADYLDAGGNLFLASMDFLSTRGDTTAFVSDYLHVASWTPDVGGFSVAGVYGDPISHEMSLGLVGGPLPNTGIDSFTTDGSADVMFTALSTPRGVRVEENGHKVAFISFPFENVKVSDPYPNNQKTLARRIIEWFMLPAHVDEGSDQEVGKLALRQNYPNPFNPSTAIAFTVPSDAERVELSVYDVSGRLVATLISGSLPAGAHVVTWDGTDAAGRSVSSGVYFARLCAGSKAAELKMTLLK